MIERIQKRWIVGGVAVLTLAVLSAACVQFAPAIAPVILPRLTNRPTDDPVYQLAQQNLSTVSPSSTDTPGLVAPTAEPRQQAS